MSSKMSINDIANWHKKAESLPTWQTTYHDGCLDNQNNPFNDCSIVGQKSDTAACRPPPSMSRC